jgi:hypothetical protein
MRALPPPLRKQLETAVLAARRAAEGAARAAIDGLGVFADRRPEHLNVDQAALRNGLREKWRQLGGDRELLVAECAYEQWHRLLFARFLAENDLLLHPQYKAALTVADCEELAAELDEPDGWSVAARFASEILPGIFRLDDPCVHLRFAPEGRHALEGILDRLPREVFVADDSLGWVYQFWQKNKKDEINHSGRKIGAADLGPVTQLFTENYMVRFLLENSLGAWWAARHPDSPLVKGFEYLQSDENGRAAVGSFDRWPSQVAELTVMDPCCGSGHFLVEAFSMLWQMRAEEEGLRALDAQNAVLRDNLFGLELDPRCVQIAMFAVALQAWKVGGGWRRLPVPNIACSGVPVRGTSTVDEWKALADGDDVLKTVLDRLHVLFHEAAMLGSLIDPRRVAQSADPSEMNRSLEDVSWEAVVLLLRKVHNNEGLDPATPVLGANAVVTARAADFLSRSYTLIATNVPYLGGGRQSESLKAQLDRAFPVANSELAAAFLSRIAFTGFTQGFAVVLPDTIGFLAGFSRLRRQLLDRGSVNFVVYLGSGSFSSVSGAVVRPLLLVGDSTDAVTEVNGLDVSRVTPLAHRIVALTTEPLSRVSVAGVLREPDTPLRARMLEGAVLLSQVARSTEGLSTGDDSRYRRKFWELMKFHGVRRIQGPPTAGHVNGASGLEEVILWNLPHYKIGADRGARLRGATAWGKAGLLIGRIGGVSCGPYFGALFDKSCVALVPANRQDLGALRAFIDSGAFEVELRQIDRKVAVATKSIEKVPFDAQRWRSLASKDGPMEEARTNDPVQWLFEGRPEFSKAPLQVAVGRLVGYRWPEQTQADDLDVFADPDGIVCLPSVSGKAPAADRVQQVLSAAFGPAWSPSKIRELLDEAGSKRKKLEDWLRDDFFKQHCAIFGNRPFVWHIWDGQRDGFSALVNYHGLDRKMLEKLTYTYLGQDWVERQRADSRDEVAGAEARMSAALQLQRKLEAILEGEKPYDVYVRWKQPHEQPIGWEPDLNDGVRLNIRPFVMAGVLRSPFNIHWKQDRGKNPDGSERHNYLHLSLSEKVDTRKRAGLA